MTQNKSIGYQIYETIKTVVYALLIAGLFRTLIYQPFWIPSGSMKPTLLIGDFLFVNKMAYGYSYASCPNLRFPSMGINLDARTLCGMIGGDNSRIWGAHPQRGDVVVFRHPISGTDYIKRLTGLPGDRIQLIDGQLNLNGKPVPQVFDGLFTETKEPQGPQRRSPNCFNGPVGFGGLCEKEQFRETLPPGGPGYNVLNTGQRSVDDTLVFQVPDEHFFFMGDNRDNSLDSRVSQFAGGVGFVPYENLIGRADRVMFSSSGRSMLFFWTWRADRYFREII